jgi:AcrR family transcriptional regulator
MRKEDNQLSNDLEKISTKQKILDSAVNLFAVKGYTETTIRELATAVGVKEASIYNHFPSKIAILEYILEEYSHITRAVYDQENINALRQNPTPDNILANMMLVFPEGKEEYYLKRLYVILQEQHRNPIVRKFMSGQFFLGTEQFTKAIINSLKDFGILRPDTDLNFWARIQSSLLYAFASRALLGIGDNEPDYSGMGLSELMWNVYDMMLKTCGTKNT